MFKNFYLTVIFFSLINCFRLDSFAFDPVTDIESYEMDNFTGDVPFTIPSTYDIDPGLVTQITLDSVNGNGDTRKIYAIYIGDTTRIGIDKVILYCHGNHGHMDYYWQRAKLLANMGPAANTYGVILFDYQGYGLSEGSPSEGNLYRDTDTIMKWLQAQGLTSNRLIIYGYSMGTAPATYLTANVRTLQPSLLILEAPFASASILVQDGTGLALPSSYFTSIDFNNADEIKNVTEPFLWIHGTDDSYINIGNGELVYANFGGSISQAVRVSGADHSDIEPVMGYDVYLTAIHDFITNNLP
jgi:pimeloyl-ACP methyl ester carboxylesterase